MAESDKISHYKRYEEGWEEHDPEVVMDAFAPGGAVIAPNLDEPRTGEEIGEWVEETIAGFPDVRFEEQDLMMTDQEDVFVVEWTFYGTHTGTLDGLPPTGNTVEFDGVDVYSISEKGIESTRIYFDQSAMADQLGLTFPAIIGQSPKLVIGAIRNAL